MHAVQASGELILERGEGCHLWDDQGNRYVDATAGLWYANVGYGRAEIADAAAAQMRTLHAYSHYGDVSSRPTTDLADRISGNCPDGRRSGVLHERRRRVDRDRRQARATLLEPARPARPHRDHLARARLPRPRRLRHEHRRHGGVQGGRRPAGRRHRPRRLGLCRGARGDDRGGRAGPCRGLLLRADHRRGRRFAPTRGVSPRGTGHLPETRCSLRRRRGHLRLRPRRRLVREHPGRARPGRRHICEGDHLGLRAAGRRDRRRAGSRSRSGTRPAAGIWRHGYTYSGHASAAAAAHANLDIIEREGLVARGLELESELTGRPGALCSITSSSRRSARASVPWPGSRSIPASSPTTPR